MSRFFGCGRIAAAVFLPLLLYAWPDSLFEPGASTFCLFRNLTGFPCPGCGMTRALVSLARLDGAAAWAYNPAVVVVAPLLLWLWAHWVGRLVEERSGRLGRMR